MDPGTCTASGLTLGFSTSKAFALYTVAASIREEVKSAFGPAA